MATVLALLPETREFITEDGLSGTLALKLDSVKVEVAGYGSSTKELTATRTYPSLVSQDTSGIPKSVEDNSHELTLQGIDWQTDSDGHFTATAIQSLELMFSASRSRRLMLVPIVQSITGQLQKNYGKEGSEIIVDNCQLNIFGGFAPASQTAEEMAKAMGNRTVLSGSINRGKDKSQSLQMTERPLMSADELKAMPKGEFINKRLYLPGKNRE